MPAWKPTRFTKMVIGTTVGVLTTALVGNAVLDLRGGLILRDRGQVDFRGPPVSLSATGTELLQVLDFPCSGSGGQSAIGNTNYVFCSASLPTEITGSGLLLGKAQLECGDIDVTGKFDTYFGKDAFGETSSGTTAIAVDAALTGTGNAMQTNTGTWVWNGADYLRIIPKNLTYPFDVSTSDCRVRGHIRDFYGD